MLARRLLLLTILLASPATAREPWQLSHGPFTTAADVREHNRMGLDLGELDSHLSATPPAWPRALELYAFGRHFKAHSLAKFADDYNGRLAGYLPRSTKHFGSASFQAHQWAAALAGTSRFAAASEAERVAFLGGAASALMINWSRYELGEAERKAKAASPNWALTNGSPKNWNEIFAFYVGPEGRHSAFAAVQKAAGGSAVNDRLMVALAEGQDVLVKQNWPADSAANVTRILDEASLVLLRDAVATALAAKDEDLAPARRRAAGMFLAAAEPLLANPAALALVEAALAGKPDRQALDAALRAITAVLNP